MQDWKILMNFEGSTQQIIGVGLDQLFQENSIEKLAEFIAINREEYLFFSLNYDVKNELFSLSSNNDDLIKYPSICCWTAKNVAYLKNNEIEFKKGTKNVIEDFLGTFQNASSEIQKINFKSSLAKKEYLEKVKKIQEHIQLGDCYEVNFCQEFRSEKTDFANFQGLYKRLNELTKAPFCTYFENDKHVVLSASPERFIKKEGNKLIAQPIKGTRPRGKTIEEDGQLKHELLHNIKERAENVMIVDLVRNDMSKLAKKGSVAVPNLFGIYSFGTVHQMISTVTCELKEGLLFTDIIKALFPMGSMTGAPKLAAMEYIEKYENFTRGLYSGTMGCIFPNGDFDSLVVIRTLIYSKEKQQFSSAVGGAITILADAEKEYEECEVKIAKILNLFDGSN